MKKILYINLMKLPQALEIFQPQIYGVQRLARAGHSVKVQERKSFKNQALGQDNTVQRQ